MITSKMIPPYWHSLKEEDKKQYVDKLINKSMELVAEDAVFISKDYFDKYLGKYPRNGIGIRK